MNTLQDIATQVNGMIPENWDKVYIYGEVTEDAGIIACYYYPKNKDEYVYSANLTQRFDIDENEFSNAEYELLQLCEQLQNDFRDNGEEVWTNFTMTLNSDGEFKIDYDYTDLSNVSDYERQIIWEYNYLNVLPQNGRPKSIIDKYIADKEI